ncbi:GNAT family N-acetyltransferase [Rhodobacterales bacterium HKCCE3408]|nr:GNAT family N-acetyltransferase [Rhodobacterales bacterium HKCCE3408]
MAGILTDWIEATPWMPRLHSDAATLDFCRMLVPRTHVALLGGDVAGFISRRGPEILTLYVADSERGRGIGAALLARAKAAEPRLALWTFAANTPARRFYAREGFAEAGGTPGDNDEGLPDIRLEWSRR